MIKVTLVLCGVLSNAHALASSGTGCPPPKLPLVSYIVCVKSEGSGETARMHRHA